MPDWSQIISDKMRIRYGPAQTRITRTPVEFSDNLSKDTLAQFFPRTSPLNILSLIPNIHSDLNTPEGVIRVNPNSSYVQNDPDRLNRLIRHESIHALLDKEGIRSVLAARAVPGYDRIADEVKRNWGGISAIEVPAYMGAFSTDDHPGISTMERNNYVTGLVTQLIKLNPRLADKFKQLAK